MGHEPNERYQVTTHGALDCEGDSAYWLIPLVIASLGERFTLEETLSTVLQCNRCAGLGRSLPATGADAVNIMYTVMGIWPWMKNLPLGTGFYLIII
jgi:hypothetical protein